MNKPLDWMQTLLATGIGSILLILAIVGFGTIFKVSSQGTSWDNIPTGRSENTFELPLDVCYSIVDQTPYIVEDGYSGGGQYLLSYISTSGNVINLVYSYDATNDHYYFSRKFIAKAAIQPKCYQLPK